MHAQSLLWLGAAVAAAAVFYRRMLGRDMGRGRRRPVVRGGRCAGRDGRVHCQPQCPDRGDVWLLGARLPRPLPARWLAPGGVPGRAFARPCPLLEGGRAWNMCLSRCLRLVPRPEGRLARLPVDDSLRRSRRGLAHSPRLLGLRRAQHGSVRRPTDGPGPVRGESGRAPAAHADEPVGPDPGRNRGGAATSSIDCVLVVGGGPLGTCDLCRRALAQTRSPRPVLVCWHVVCRHSRLRHVADGPAR